MVPNASIWRPFYLHLLREIDKGELQIKIQINSIIRYANRGMQAKTNFVRSSTIKVEHFEIYLSGMAKNAFKYSTMVGENFEIHLSQMGKCAFKLSTMVGENFKLFLPQISRIIHFDHFCFGEICEM